MVRAAAGMVTPNPAGLNGGLTSRQLPSAEALGIFLRTNARIGVVRHDEGDEESVTPERVLLRGKVEDGALVRAASARVGEGASVSVDRGDGWVSMVGSRGVYVRFPKASHGVWHPLSAVYPGGAARPPKARAHAMASS